MSKFTKLLGVIRKIKAEHNLAISELRFLDDYDFNRLQQIIYDRTPTTLEYDDIHEVPFPDYMRASELHNNERDICTAFVDSNYGWVQLDNDGSWAHPDWDAISAWDGSWYDADWLNVNTSICLDCGYRYHTDELVGSGYCGGCYRDESDSDEHSDVLDYSADVLRHLGNRFHYSGKWHNDPKNIRVMGVELEILGRKKDLAEELANADNYILKHDGSVQGVELVTLPLDLKGHRKVMDWPRICRSIAAAEGGVGHSTGIHIHINKASLNSSDEAKLVYFLGAKNHQDFNTQLAGRDYYTNTYCSCPHGDIPLPALKKAVDKAATRYTPVNLTNDTTVEIRIWRASVHPERIMACIETADSLCEWVRQTSLNEIHPYFYVEWVKKHRKEYPKLYRLFERKQMLNQPRPLRLDHISKAINRQLDISFLAA